MRPKLYYVVLLRGLPVSVFTSESAALCEAKERSVVGGATTVIPCTPLQYDLEFDDGVCRCTYEVGSGGPLCTCGRASGAV